MPVTLHSFQRKLQIAKQSLFKRITIRSEFNIAVGVAFRAHNIICLRWQTYNYSTQCLSCKLLVFLKWILSPCFTVLLIWHRSVCPLILEYWMYVTCSFWISKFLSKILSSISENTLELWLYSMMELVRTTTHKSWTSVFWCLLHPEIDMSLWGPGKWL